VKKTPVLLFGMLLGVLLVGQSMASDQRNLLANPAFDFHSFINHRDGKAISYSAQNVACWNTDGAGDITVQRSSHIDRKLHPPVFFRNGVKIEPGKRMLQFFTLPEAQLLPGDSVSLKFYATPGIKGTLRLMKFDSEDGTWSPSDFGMADKRSFPKHSRGELVVADAVEVRSPGDGIAAQACVLEGFQVRSTFNDKNESDSSAIFAAGLEVEFANESGSAAWVFAPSLIKSQTAEDAVGELRETPEIYRHIPRTIQKLWKGEPIHIIIMGSSIDRGSANPPMYPYNEDSSSPDFKKPLCDAYDGSFSAEMLGRADLAEHLAQPRHYFSYGGRLKRELMVKFNLPADKILLNFMAADGSCVGESHSGLRAYCELSIPPGPGDNGHKSGKTWQELYPALFSRPGGARPDLVIYGSGANEKTDTPDEVAVFEGAIRYIQRNYPNTEFLFCMFQNQGGYTPSPGDLQAIALRYQIPFIDFGLVSDLVNTHGNRYAQVPIDGHPQAAAHYLWFKQLEKAFECHDPVATGQAQLQLPERVHPNTYGWEGEMLSYHSGSPRIFRPDAFIIDDSAFNCWGSFNGEKVSILVDGKEVGTKKAASPRIDPRNSLFRFGRLTLGDRHIVELAAEEAEFTGFDAKICPNRQFICISSPLWQGVQHETQEYASQTGYPYGKRILILEPGQSITINAVGSDFSAVWVDAEGGGTLQASIDDEEVFTVSTAEPFIFRDGTCLYLENRKGILDRAYGVHTLKFTAQDGPVRLMGLFTYDKRSNRANERILRGYATPGAVVIFQPPFKATPLVHSACPVEQINCSQVTFGAASGIYEIIGE
jgi:hypothetical protein